MFICSVHLTKFTLTCKSIIVAKCSIARVKPTIGRTICLRNFVPIFYVIDSVKNNYIAKSRVCGICCNKMELENGKILEKIIFEKEQARIQEFLAEEGPNKLKKRKL